MKKALLSLALCGALFAGWQDMLGVAVKSFGGTQQKSTTSVASDKEQSAIKQALEIGVKKAVSALGKKDGFYKNELVKIALPKNAQVAASTLRKIGMGKYVDQFELAMNRAAEEAVPETANILVDTVKNMKLSDVKKILSGGDTAATDYFKTHAGDRLAKAIAPIIKKHMEKEQVTRYYQMMMQAYNKYAKPYTQNAYAKAALGALGMDTSAAPKEDEKDLATYVTNRTLQGLYTMIAQQEKAIRTSPAARTTKLLQEVFGGAR